MLLWSYDSNVCLEIANPNSQRRHLHCAHAAATKRTKLTDGALIQTDLPYGPVPLDVIDVVNEFCSVGWKILTQCWPLVHTIDVRIYHKKVKTLHLVVIHLAQTIFLNKICWSKYLPNLSKGNNNILKMSICLLLEHEHNIEFDDVITPDADGQRTRYTRANYYY